MKRVFSYIITLTTICSFTSCVDKSYDLKNLDTKITILPGINVPIDNGEVLNESFNKFLSLENNSTKTEEGTSVIKGKQSEQINTTFEESSIVAGVKYPIAGKLETKFDITNEFLSIPEIGKALASPSIKVIVTNPSPISLTFKAIVTDGKIEKNVTATIGGNKTCNLYISEKGNSPHLAGEQNCIDATCVGFNQFFAGDIPERLTVTQMELSSTEAKSVMDGTKGERNYTVNLSSVGIIDLTFNPGAEITYNTTIDVPKDFSITDYNFEKGDEAVMNATVEKVGIPFDLTPSVTTDLDNIRFSFEPATFVASKDKDEFIVKGYFLNDPKDYRSFGVSVIIKNPSSNTVSLSGSESIKFTLSSISSTNGVNL